MTLPSVMVASTTPTTPPNASSIDTSNFFKWVIAMGVVGFVSAVSLSGWALYLWRKCHNSRRSNDLARQPQAVGANIRTWLQSFSDIVLTVTYPQDGCIDPEIGPRADEVDSAAGGR